jgi:hypothetical protein
MNIQDLLNNAKNINPYLIGMGVCILIVGAVTAQSRHLFIKVIGSVAVAFMIYTMFFK